MKNYYSSTIPVVVYGKFESAQDNAIDEDSDCTHLNDHTHSKKGNNLLY